MFRLSLARGGTAAAVLILACASAVLGAQSATPRPKPARTPAVVLSGFFRSYYFTRQNASNNPGATGPNQAAWEQAVSLHAQAALTRRWYAGASYLFAGPLNAASPILKPDNTLPDFVLSTFYEAFLAYHTPSLSAKIGDQVFESAWARDVDTRVKPAAFQGADVTYTAGVWTFEVARMLKFQDRIESAFHSDTLLTSRPLSGNGLASNIYVPGAGSITTSGFGYGRAGCARGSLEFNADYYAIYDLLNMSWFDAKYTAGRNRFKPYLWVQGGTEHNAGASYAGKIDSAVAGAQIGATPVRNVDVELSYDDVPSRYDTVRLPKNVACKNQTYQIATSKTTFAYFLPVNAGQCFTNVATGLTTIAYGGWATPYTDNHANNPEFTTSISQGEPDRRAPARSWKIEATIETANRRAAFVASDAWYDYANAFADERTHEWDLDARYRFNRAGSGPYHGLMLRHRYMNRTLSNTAVLGGLPLFVYNRTMLEYDF